MDGVVYLVVGLAGAGKTSVANLMVDYLRSIKKNVLHWDGDVIRGVFSEEYDKKYDRDSRLSGCNRDANVICMLSKQGIDVVVSTIGMFENYREKIKRNAVKCVEIYIDCPMDVLLKRDKKGLYSGALSGNIKDVVGVDITPEIPQNPDIYIYNDGTLTVEQIFQKIKDTISIYMM